MSTTIAPDTERSGPGSLTGEPQWLALEPEPIYAVLHTPEHGRAGRAAALILPTFGWDDECSYRRRRDWATQLAASGVTTARIDFPGSENSAGSPLAPGRVASWVQATIAAARWLREASGCARITAIGIGLGGLIACEALAHEAAIDDLILWGVRASGRAYVRELRAYAAVTGRADARDAARPDGALGIGGHLMSAETAASLSAIDLTRLPLPHATMRRVLLIGRDAHGVDPRLREHLERSGVELTVLESDEYRRMMSPPDLGAAPNRTLAATVAWLQALDAEALPQLPHPAATERVPTATRVTTLTHGGVAIRERLTTLETTAGRLVGIISEPLSEAGDRCCLVVVNSGALRHTGPNRMFVEVARRAAAAGIPAARFDLPGLGDSDGTAVRSFERTADDDAVALQTLAQIYDHLEQLGVATRFIAGGFSLGGYLTLRAALAEPRVRAAICVNPTGFSWTVKQRQRVLRDLTALAGPEALTGEPVAASWPPALQQAADRLGRLRRTLDARARRRLARSELLWSLEHRREIRDLHRRLDQLHGSGTRMLLLLSDNEQLLRMLDRPRLAARLAGCDGLVVERLPDEDHLLRPLWIQELVIRRFTSALLELGAAGARTSTENNLDAPDRQRGVIDAS